MAALTTADCVALSDIFTRESGRIVSQIQKRMHGRNIMLDLIKRSPFPDGMGQILSAMTVERGFTADNDGDNWTAQSISTGTGSAACLPPASRITTGQTLRQFQLYKAVLESDRLCLEDLRTSFQIEQQLGITFDSMTNAVQWRLEQQAINQYIALSAHKINANSLFQTQLQTTQTNFSGANMPTSILTQGMLDNIYLNLSRDSFGDGSVGRSGNAYVYSLICSPETSRSLIRDNADIRQDFRYAFMGDKLESDLLKPYGVDRSYGNYVHTPYYAMPRYDLVGNVLTRRNYWDTTVATTKGFAPQVSTAYLNAEFEVSIVFNSNVYNWLVPGALNAPGGNTRFTTPDYFPATISWKNIPHEVCNPDGTIGFFRAVLAMAPMPVHPEYGYAILHKRCAPTTNQVGCALS